MVLGYRHLLLLLALVLFVGCDDEIPISSYEAPKEPIVTELPPVQRMLGAMLPAKEVCWFLKVNGEPEQIAAIRDEFEAFAKSVDVSGNEPKWKLPEGWQERAGDQLRYRTIVIPVDGARLGMSVTRLELGDGKLTEYLLSNTNRWRRQLQLPPIEEQELDEQLEKVDRGGKNPIYLCELQGVPEDTGMGAAPFASNDSGANSNATGSSANGSGAETTVRTQPPPEWQPGRLNPLRKAAFVVSDGDQQAETTVTFLTAAGGEILPNVQRWRGQVGLPPISESDLAKETQTLEVDGKAAPYFVMHGPDEAPQRQSTLVVVVPRGELVWFVKMMGDTELVRREQQRFEEFARTLQFQ